MEPVGWQIVSSLVDGRLLAPTIQERRRLADAVLWVGESPDLFCFSEPDSHLHPATAGSRTMAGVLGVSIEQLPLMDPCRYGFLLAAGGEVTLTTDDVRRLRKVDLADSARPAYLYLLRGLTRGDPGQAALLIPERGAGPLEPMELAIVEIHRAETGQDLGFDLEAWRVWLLAQGEDGERWCTGRGQAR